jgi:hypothetical protein
VKGREAVDVSSVLHGLSCTGWTEGGDKAIHVFLPWLPRIRLYVQITPQKTPPPPLHSPPTHLQCSP